MVKRSRGARLARQLRAALLLPLPLIAMACTNTPAPPAEATGVTVDTATTPEADGAPLPPVAELPDRSVFVDSALQVDARSREALRAALGTPQRLLSEAVPNRHVPGVMDTIYTVHYPDLVARIHHPGGGGDLLSMVQVSDNRHLRYPVLGLGVAAIDAAFGAPDEASDSSLTYYCTTCEAGDDPVELVFVGGELRRVRFNYYVD